MVLTILKEAGVTLKLKQCAFFTNYIDYLGHAIKLGLFEDGNRTAAAIYKLKVTTTVTKLRSFRGLCNNFGQIVQSFAKTALPLSRRLRKTKEEELGPPSGRDLIVL